MGLRSGCRLQSCVRVLAGVLLIAGVTGGGWALPQRTELVLNPETGHRAAAVAGQLIVRLKPGQRSDLAYRAHRSVGARVLSSCPALGWQLVACPSGRSLAQTITDYRRQPGIRDAGPNFLCQACAEGGVGPVAAGRSAASVTPNDPSFGSLYGMRRIAAPEAWSLRTSSEPVVIAILDAGIDLDHPDLAANLWSNSDEIAGNGKDDDGNGYADDVHGWDYVEQDADPDAQDQAGKGFWHGTHCAGIAGAVGNNGLGVVGVNWRCRLMSVRVLDSTGNGGLYALSCGITYAADNGAGVLSISIGGEYRSWMQDSIDYAYAHDCVVCAALGNASKEFTTDQSTWCSPVCNDGTAGVDNKILGVAATTATDQKLGMSNYSRAYSLCDCAAPGAGILSTVWPAAYGTHTGTSMATPHVAGLAALLRAQFPSYSNKQIMGLITAGADNIDAANPSYAGKLGAGRINAYHSLSSPTPGPATLVAHSVDEDGGGGSVGNGNRLVEPGETIALGLTLKNQGQAALSGVVARLTTTAGGVTIPTAQLSVGTIGGGAMVAPAGRFLVKIGAAVAENTTLAFSLALTATNAGPYTASFSVHVGHDGWGEPDNSAPLAAVTATDGSARHRRLEAVSDRDWFRFAARAGYRYALRTSNLGPLSAAAPVAPTAAARAASVDTVLELYGTDGTTRLAANDNGGGGQASLINWIAPAAGTYYARVRSRDAASSGVYDLSITELAPAVAGPLACLAGLSTESTGDGDGLVEPGESMAVGVRLQNQGQLALSEVVARLSSTAAGVTVTQASLSVGTVGAGATLTPAGRFAVAVASTVPDNTDLQFSLVLSAANGGPYQCTLTLHVGHDAWGEPDGSPKLATVLATDATLCHRRLETATDRDWFRFAVLQGRRYVLRTSNLGALSGADLPGRATTADTLLELYDTDGTSRLAFNGNSGGTLASELAWTAPASGTYFARVRSQVADGRGCYDFSVSEAGALVPGPLVYVSSTTADSDGDGNVEPGENVALKVTVRNTGTAAAKTVSGVLSCSTAGVTVTAANDTFGSVAAGGRATGQTGFSLRVGTQVLSGETVACRLRLTAANCGPYDLALTFPVSSGDWDDWGEPDNTAVQAYPAAADGLEHTRKLEQAGDCDWFRFRATAGETYSMWAYYLTAPAGTARREYLFPYCILTLYGPEATTQLAQDQDSGEYGWSPRIGWTCPTTGTYYLKCAGVDRTCVGSYCLAIIASGRGVLSAHSPATGAVGVPRQAPVSFTFNAPVQHASAEEWISLWVAGTFDDLKGSFAWDSSSRQVTFTPAAPLAPATTYEAHVNPSVVRLDGRRYGGGAGWVFTTGSGPAVTSRAPQGTAVATTAPVVVVFDQAMNHAAAEGNLVLSPLVAGTPSWSGNTLTFRPTSGLAPNQQYTVAVKAAARSVAGEKLGRDLVWSFRTAAAPSAAAVPLVEARGGAAGARITLTLAAPAEVRVAVLNLAGRTVAELTPGPLPAGTQTLWWSGRCRTGALAPDGQYLVRVQALQASGSLAQAVAGLTLRR